MTHLLAFVPESKGVTFLSDDLFNLLISLFIMVNLSLSLIHSPPPPPRTAQFVCGKWRRRVTWFLEVEFVYFVSFV